MLTVYTSKNGVLKICMWTTNGIRIPNWTIGSDPHMELHSHPERGLGDREGMLGTQEAG